MARNQKPQPLFIAVVSLSALANNDNGRISLRVHRDTPGETNRVIYAAMTNAPIDDALMAEMETAAFTEWERECAHLFGSQARLW